MNTFLATAKTWAAFVGAILTALVGTLTPDDTGYRALTIALAVVTAIAVYRVPNARPSDRGPLVAYRDKGDDEWTDISNGTEE